MHLTVLTDCSPGRCGRRKLSKKRRRPRSDGTTRLASEAEGAEEAEEEADQPDAAPHLRPQPREEQVKIKQPHIRLALSRAGTATLTAIWTRCPQAQAQRHHARLVRQGRGVTLTTCAGGSSAFEFPATLPLFLSALLILAWLLCMGPRCLR